MSKPSKKNYSVSISAFATVLVVGAESEDKALEYARDIVSMGDLQLDSAEVKCVVSDEELERHRRHADAVAEED